MPSEPPRAVIVCGRTYSPWTVEITREIAGQFPEHKVILYLHDSPDDPNLNRVNDVVDELYFDAKVSANRPSTPDRDYLRDVESRYSIDSLWRAVGVDRMLIKQGELDQYNWSTTPYSQEELLAHLEARVRIFEQLFQENEIEFVYDQHIMRLGGMVLHQFARGTSTPFFRASTTRLKDYFAVFENVYEESQQVLDVFQAAKADPSLLDTFDATLGVRDVTLGDTQFRASADNVLLRGRVTNERNSELGYIEAIGRVYDGEGRLLATDYTNETDLAAGADWTFEIEPRTLGRNEQVKAGDIVLTEGFF